MSIRICVTGGRDYADAAKVDEALSHLYKLYGISRLAHGGADGADALAAAWAVRIGAEVVAYPVTGDEWRDLGKAAGPIRNGRMLATEDPDMLVVFPGGRGTADCERQARKRGIFVQRVKP